MNIERHNAAAFASDEAKTMLFIHQNPEEVLYSRNRKTKPAKAQ